MDEEHLRVLLVIAGIPLFWLFVVYPLKWVINKLWPESKIKQFLFKTR